uniref:F-box domain-containing protein n=1 Tax=Mycena chlorophos TaxID=658473 RepID=A0ABQ0LIY6_MYCCL|nr:predicted protein [Mycena chlorophos]
MQRSPPHAATIHPECVFPQPFPEPPSHLTHLSAISKLFLRSIPQQPDARKETSIHALPQDLLISIFEFAIESESGSVGIFPGTAFVASHVCTLWRILVLHTPSLWTRIDCSSAWKMHESVRRSGTLALILRVDATTTGYHACDARAMRHAVACEALEMPTVRMRAKDVSVLVEFSSKRLECALGAEFPNLERLYLRATRLPSPTPSESLPLAPGGPGPPFTSLHMLKLGAINPVISTSLLFRAADTLQTLDIDAAVTDEFLDAVSSLRNLTTLKLAISPTVPSSPRDTHLGWILPRVRFLVLSEQNFGQTRATAKITSGASFLQAVRLPAMRRCTLLLDRIPAGPLPLMTALDRILSAHYSTDYRRTDVRLQRDDATTRYHCGNLDFPSYHVDLSFRLFPAESHWTPTPATSASPHARELILSWHHSELMEDFADVVPAALEGRHYPSPTGTQALPALSATRASISGFQIVGWELTKRRTSISPSLRCDWAALLDGLATSTLLDTVWLENCSPELDGGARSGG